MNNDCGLWIVDCGFERTSCPRSVPVRCSSIDADVTAAHPASGRNASNQKNFSPVGNLALVFARAIA